MPIAQRLRMQLADRYRAEEISAGQHAQRTPGGKHHQRQRDPAAPGSHVLHPLRRVDERQEAAGESRASAAEHHGEIADADDVDAERMRRAVIVANRAQRQAGAGPEQEPGDAEGEQDRDVEDRVLAEKQLADERNVGQAGNIERCRA